MIGGSSGAVQTASDDVILEYVKGGVLRVDPDGSVWRCRKRQVGRGYAKWIDCKPPVRAENWASGQVRVPSCHSVLRYCYSVSRLVWLVLVGPIPDDKRVFHRDRNRNNNHPSNLFLADRMSFRGRALQRVDEGLFEFCRNPREQLILHAVITHGSQYAAAKELGCNIGVISGCLTALHKRALEDAGA